MILSFDILENWNYPDPFPKNVRTELVLKKYNEFKTNLELKIEDYILEKYLKDKMFSIDLNAFPYNVNDGMSHYVLWINPIFEKKITNKKIIEIIINKMKELNCNEFFCFENNKLAKSVDGILHYQVFFGKC